MSKQVSGSLEPLNYNNGGPLLAKGDPAICAQLFIDFLRLREKVQGDKTYQFSMTVYRESRRNEFLSLRGPSDEADDTIVFNFKGDELHTKMVREFGRVVYNKDHGVLLWDICLRLDMPPIAEGMTTLQTSINERCAPISVREYVALVNKFHDFQTSALSHIAAGSPRLGLNDAFMSRVSLIELRDYIISVLEKKP